MATPQKHRGTPMVRILIAAEQLTGDADRAIIWFRHQPIAGFVGKTALDLVEAGHADAVLAHPLPPARCHGGDAAQARR